MNSSLKNKIHTLNQRVEYKPVSNTIISLQYMRNHDKKYHYTTIIRDNPVFSVIKRWNRQLQTRMNLSYWKEERINGTINEIFSSISPLIGIGYRKISNSTFRTKFEVRNDISFAFYRTSGTILPQSYNSITNALALDYYPLSVLSIRLKLNTTFRDQFHSQYDLLSNYLEFRLIAEF